MVVSVQAPSLILSTTDLGRWANCRPCCEASKWSACPRHSACPWGWFLIYIFCRTSRALMEDTKLKKSSPWYINESSVHTLHWKTNIVWPPKKCMITLVSLRTILKSTKPPKGDEPGANTPSGSGKRPRAKAPAKKRKAAVAEPSEPAKKPKTKKKKAANWFEARYF